MPKHFDLAARLNAATSDAEDGARKLRKLFDDFAFDNENVTLGGEPPISELSETEMQHLHTVEGYLFKAARRISEIKTTLAIRKGGAV